MDEIIEIDSSKQNLCKHIGVLYKGKKISKYVSKVSFVLIKDNVDVHKKQVINDFKKKLKGKI